MSTRSFAPEPKPADRQTSTPARAPDPDISSSAPVSHHVSQDLGKIPIHPPAIETIAAKLAINHPRDAYEQEAERVAGQVMRMPEPPLQTRRIPSAGTGPVAAPSALRDGLRSRAQPLDPAIRSFMEPRFGHDFSRVRVHDGGAAVQSARGLGAKAYTTGQSIVFGAGQFAPGTHAGRQLLAHELTHVVQQSGANAINRAGRPGAVPVALSSPLRIARQVDPDFAEEDDEFLRDTAEDKADRRRRKQSPPTGADVTSDAAAQIRRMIQEAREGAFRHVNTPNRQRAMGRFRRLLDNYRASEIQSIESELENTPGGKKRRGEAAADAAGRLARRKALVNHKMAIVRERTQWQFKFDEAMRTPAGADVQEKMIHGGQAKDYHETRPGHGSYAQLDYATTVSHDGGGRTRVHVNLKSHNLRDLTLTEARSIARAVVEQATKNAFGNPKKYGSVGHLPHGDRLVISFIDQPDPMIQREMDKIMRAEGSPIEKVQFGTASHPQVKPPTPPRGGGAGSVPPVTPAKTSGTTGAQPPQQPSQLPEPPVPHATSDLPKGTTLETAPLAATPKADTASQPAKPGSAPAAPASSALPVHAGADVPAAGTKKAGPSTPTSDAGAAVAKSAVKTPDLMGANNNANKGAVEGAAALINAGILNALRSSEMQKAVDALAKLAREIEEYRRQGYGVTVTLVAEVPDQVDIAAIWGGVGDTSQVVYFKKMYLSAVMKDLPKDTTHSYIVANLAPGDPDQDDPHQRTLEQKIKGQMGDPYPVPGTGPKPGFHFASNNLYLPSHTARLDENTEAEKSEPNSLKGIAGTYEAKLEKVFIGDASVIPTLILRRLHVEQGAGDKLLPRMSTMANQPFSYRPYAISGKMVMGGQFSTGEGSPPHALWLSSMMEYPQEGLILEWVKGLDSGLNRTSDALISWHKR